ncbi:MAG: DNA helicase UvrD [Candidatus Magasanikbacteria bacterium]|nr:DNA helicase UvrD [Candidatus Magasanikbacteria bacterium]
MQKILDLHTHSKYSRACSHDLELPNIVAACVRKGVDIVATGDFTHPGWFQHIKECLEEVGEGVYELKKQEIRNKKQTISNIQYQISNINFVIGTEVAVIKKHKGETRRLHLCVYAPDIETAEKFNNKLDAGGFNLKSDGRPILGLTAKELLAMMLEVDERMVMIPAHAWTPWFGVFGSKSGYESLEEAFEELTPRIFAIETGLSSDPLMNWRWSKLDNITLVSNSDAHSCAKLGREANVMQFNSEVDVTYDNIMRIIKDGDRKKFLYTIEFYPEEGKYHYDGHRDCEFVCSPKETARLNGICPICKKLLTIGVENRVHELSDRDALAAEKMAEKKIPYKSMVPLPEIIADTLQVGVNSKAVGKEYDSLIKNFGSEFNILLNISVDEIKKASSERIATAIAKVRAGDIHIKPGYDGEFGVVKVFGDGEKRGHEQVGLDI